MKYPFGVMPTTPTEINATVRSFVNEELGDVIDLQFVPVKIMGIAQRLDCFNNVERYIEAAGGSRRYGWAIWQHGDGLIEAEFHSVWLSPSGELIDITPHDGEERILFAMDNRLRYTGRAIPNRRRLLRHDDAAKKALQRIIEREEFEANPPPNVIVRWPSAMRSAQVQRNGPCPCGSGIKYKKCCARLDL